MISLQQHLHLPFFWDHPALQPAGATHSSRVIPKTPESCWASRDSSGLFSIYKTPGPLNKQVTGENRSQALCPMSANMLLLCQSLGLYLCWCVEWACAPRDLAKEGKYWERTYPARSDSSAELCIANAELNLVSSGCIQTMLNGAAGTS